MNIYYNSSIIIMCDFPDDLKFIRKKQHNKNNGIFNDENYFLQPSIKIILNNPTIHEINPKYIVFKCSDNDIIYLSELSNKLIDKFKECIILNDETNTIHHILQKNLFRCVLPSSSWNQSKNYSTNYSPTNYNFQFYVKDILCKFKLHSIDKSTHIQKVVIHIKNIWNSNNKCGMNCTIDEMYIH